jgi:hypothetical protein
MNHWSQKCQIFYDIIILDILKTFVCHTITNMVTPQYSEVISNECNIMRICTSRNWTNKWIINCTSISWQFLLASRYRLKHLKDSKHHDILPSDSSVGIALGCGLDYRGSRVRFPAGAGNFSLHHRVQNGSGAHPASYPIGTRGSFPGGKAAGAWRWPLTST